MSARMTGSFPAGFLWGAVTGALWVPGIRFTSCDLRILMDQPTESISAHNPSGRQDDRWFGWPEWWGLPQGAVWAVDVAVIGELGQHRRQVLASEDQDPIQHFTPNGADPALGDGVGTSRQLLVIGRVRRLGCG
jgi:hypothetical protein